LIPVPTLIGLSIGIYAQVSVHYFYLLSVLPNGPQIMLCVTTVPGTSGRWQLILHENSYSSEWSNELCEEQQDGMYGIAPQSAHPPNDACRYDGLTTVLQVPNKINHRGLHAGFRYLLCLMFFNAVISTTNYWVIISPYHYRRHNLLIIFNMQTNKMSCSSDGYYNKNNYSNQQVS
jgi:hypothetical protein